MREKNCVKAIIQIPLYNEEENIENTLQGLPININGVDLIEIVVINDGSGDQTIKKLQNLNVGHIIDLPCHYGLGRAFKEGLKYAYTSGADVIVNTDGDNQYPGSEIHKIIEPILNNKADMAIGARQLNRISDYPLYKLASQYIGNLIVSKLFNEKIKDVTSGFRAMSRDCAGLLLKELNNAYTYTLESICVLLKEKKRISFIPIKTNHPTRKSRLVTSKGFYVKNFFTTLIRRRFLTNEKH